MRDDSFLGRYGMLESIAWISLLIAFACALIIAIDEYSHPQKLWIMNIVWPLTALYFSVFALWGYFSAGRKMSKTAMSRVGAEEHRREMERRAVIPPPPRQRSRTRIAQLVAFSETSSRSTACLAWDGPFSEDLSMRNTLAICCLRGSLASHSNTSPSSQCETFPQSRA